MGFDQLVFVILYGLVDEWIHEWIDEWLKDKLIMDGQTNKQMGAWMDG